MTDTTSDLDQEENTEESLRARLADMERANEADKSEANRRIALAELKVEAMKAGMIDLDGLAFIDMAQVQLGDDGKLVDGSSHMSRLKQSKPWLFASSSSSFSKVPPSRPARVKMATEMTDDEYQIARQNIIRRSQLS